MFLLVKQSNSTIIFQTEVHSFGRTCRVFVVNFLNEKHSDIHIAKQKSDVEIADRASVTTSLGAELTRAEISLDNSEAETSLD